MDASYGDGFRPCLLVMNPRRIFRCVRAIDALAIDKLWLSFMWERELEPVVEAIVERTSYTHFLMLADDCVPTQGALDLVLAELFDADRASRPSAVTGYCNNYVGSQYVNVTRRPFANTERSVLSDYDWWTREAVESIAGDALRTWFAGMVFTGMNRDLWKRFPFRAVTSRDARGYCSDWSLSTRLQKADVPIYAPRGAFVEHLATRTRSEQGSFDPKDDEMKLLVGREAPEVRWDRLGSSPRVAAMRAWTLDPLYRLLES